MSESRSRGRKTLTIISVLALLAVATAGIAALLSRAEIDASATTGDQSIYFATINGAGGAHLKNDTLTEAVVADGACTASIVDGKINVSWTGLWEGSECLISGPGAVNQFLTVATASAPVSVTGWEYPTGYGAPASGEPIEVRLLNSSNNPVVFPINLTVAAPASTVKIKLTVNADVAEPATSYDGTLALVGG